ncbi:MAG: hypothetical protein ONB16_01780 [candidate division KSB1 bacterium]|nr:hypothetical protein [candidate division KSB1 bacterium]MDZ7317587.1 hypothetical protein [candidate division KSB1 bacterium]MDZ7340194.1 hypothetical protein [candidate division KSB1 bacterium]
MSTQNSKLLVLILGVVILVGWASTGLAQSNEYASNDNGVDHFAQRVEERLSKINAVITLYPVGDRRYDVLVSWHVDSKLINLLMSSDNETKMKTLGTIVGMMMVSAAVIGEEAPTANFQSRNIVFKFNGEKLAHIPLTKCHHLMSKIRYELTENAVEEFLTNLVLY